MFFRLSLVAATLAALLVQGTVARPENNEVEGLNSQPAETDGALASRSVEGKGLPMDIYTKQDELRSLIAEKGVFMTLLGQTGEVVGGILWAPFYWFIRIGDYIILIPRLLIEAILPRSNNNMSIKVYYAPPSPPSRVVRTAAKALGVPLEEHIVDLTKGEQMTPEFLKLNPQHTVPVMVDNDLVITESRAIITYLADKYGKDDKLYPKSLKTRAVVNQRLYFDAGTLYQRFSDLYFPYIFTGVPLDEEKAKKLGEAFEILDKYLEKTKWVASDSITLADISIAVTVSTAEVVGYDVSKYPNVAAWLAKAKTSLPGYEVNQKGVEAFKGMADFLISQHKK